MIANNQDAFQPGAPAPDWGYACGFHDAGEAMHWEPFQVAAFNYINRTYERPWGVDAQKLVAFLLGVNSHAMADINWHGLGEAAPRWATPTSRGFIKFVGGIEFNCDGVLCDAAHSNSDTGGEFVVGSQYDLSWEEKTWHLPVYIFNFGEFIF